MNLNAELEFAIELARGAGKIVLEHFGRVERLTKTHAAATAEAVTDADRASQRFIVAGLKQQFPADGIVGEESDSGHSITFDCPDPAGRVWVIDPIDGTNNFVAGLPEFAVCIGLLQHGDPIMGVVLDVCRGSVYSAVRGQGTQLNGVRVEAAQTPLNDSSMLLLTSNLLDKTGRLPQYVVNWMSQTTWKVRILGSAALEAANVAAGAAHAALTINGKLWDIAAPAALVLESGGIITSPSGAPIFPFSLAGYCGAKVPFLAAAPKAHGPILEQMRQNP